MVWSAFDFLPRYFDNRDKNGFQFRDNKQPEANSGETGCEQGLRSAYIFEANMFGSHPSPSFCTLS